MGTVGSFAGCISFTEKFLVDFPEEGAFPFSSTDEMGKMCPFCVGHIKTFKSWQIPV